ncbi:metal-dependent hydrolase [Desulfofalx alkaliphila]|uniref:metal-dependent hydrolase n=1 Tax=Desulfofalx alkaliphila TaxID=105483 RepID=UPI003083022D
MLRYLLLAVVVAVCILVPEKGGIFLLPLAVMIGSLLPDIDHPNSTLSQMIAPTGLVIRLLVVAAGSLIVWQGWGTYWIMAAGGALALVGLLNIKVLPMELLQRMLLIITGVALIAWANTPLVSGLGVMYFIMGIISHRGLTHSLEGAIIAIIGAWWFTINIGHPELLIPFAIGYIMHLLADLIADSGIYLSYFAKSKISIPIIKTGFLVDRAIGIVVLAISLILLTNISSYKELFL